jgi:hypothetical protein
LWFFLTFAAVFVGMTYFNYFFSSFMQTITDPNTWLIVALVITGSLIYRWTNREEKSHQYQ